MQPKRQGQLFFYLLLLFTLYITYLLLRPYLGVIVFALVVVIIFEPVYDSFRRRFKRHELALAVTLSMIVFLVVAPLVFLTNLLIDQGVALVETVRSTVAGTNASLSLTIEQINDLLAELPLQNQYQIEESDVIQAAQNLVQPVSTFLADRAWALGSSSADLITKFIIFLSVVGTLFPNYPNLIQLLKDLSPLNDKLDQIYVNRIIAMTKAMVRGVFVIALVQGMAAGLFFWMAGTSYTFFLTVLAVFVAVLPLGVNILAIPVGAIHLAFGNIWQGLLIIVGSLLVISQLDNILRPKLVSNEAYLNPALVLLSAFGGLSLFGFLGVVYGPIIMIFFVTTVEIYLDHFQVDLPTIANSEEVEAEKQSSE